VGHAARAALQGLRDALVLQDLLANGFLDEFLMLAAADADRESRDLEGRSLLASPSVLRSET
jgi:hypothetical protein